MKAIAYLMYGAQGSGKSTQGQVLADELHVPFFDTGSELRRVARSRSPLAKTIKDEMAAGRLVGNTILETVINQFFAAHPMDSGVVLDGFPRTVEEVALFEKLAKRYGWLAVAVYIKISDSTIEQRIKARAKIEHRTDDEPAVIAERLAIFHKETLPVINYLKTHYQLVEIDGEPSIAVVTKSLMTALHTTHGSR